MRHATRPSRTMRTSVTRRCPSLLSALWWYGSPMRKVPGVVSRAVMVGLAGAAVALVCPPDASALPPPGGATGDAANNQAQFNATFSQIAAQYGTQRDVSPTKNVFPGSPQDNGAHVPNYGLRSD